MNGLSLYLWLVFIFPLCCLPSDNILSSLKSANQPLEPCIPISAIGGGAHYNLWFRRNTIQESLGDSASWRNAVGSKLIWGLFQGHALKHITIQGYDCHFISQIWKLKVRNNTNIRCYIQSKKSWCPELTHLVYVEARPPNNHSSALILSSLDQDGKTSMGLWSKL